MRDIRLTARLLSEIHNISISNIHVPPQREIVKNQILSVNYLNEMEKNYVINLLDSLPQSGYLCMVILIQITYLYIMASLL